MSDTSAEERYDLPIRGRFRKQYQPYAVRICAETLDEIAKYDDCQIMLAGSEHPDKEPGAFLKVVVETTDRNPIRAGTSDPQKLSFNKKHPTAAGAVAREGDGACSEGAAANICRARDGRCDRSRASRPSISIVFSSLQRRRCVCRPGGLLYCGHALLRSVTRAAGNVRHRYGCRF